MLTRVTGKTLELAFESKHSGSYKDLVGLQLTAVSSSGRNVFKLLSRKKLNGLSFRSAIH